MASGLRSSFRSSRGALTASSGDVPREAVQEVRPEPYTPDFAVRFDWACIEVGRADARRVSDSWIGPFEMGGDCGPRHGNDRKNQPGRLIAPVINSLIGWNENGV